MTTTTVPLDEVAHRIAQHQAELAALRREYETRQARLAKLDRRRKALQKQLLRVEKEIQAVASGSKVAVPVVPTAPTAPKPAAVQPKASVLPRQTLPQLLVDMVRKAGQPLTASQLAKELIRRKYPTTSKNLAAMIQTRLDELVRKGVLRRTKEQPGVTLAPTANGQQTAARSAKRPSAAVPPTTQPAAASSARPIGIRGLGQPSLQTVLTQILEKSKQPLGASELARLAKAAGYRSKSKDFSDVVGVMLRKMKNVQHVPGQGYRLIKS